MKRSLAPAALSPLLLATPAHGATINAVPGADGADVTRVAVADGTVLQSVEAA